MPRPVGNSDPKRARSLAQKCTQWERTRYGTVEIGGLIVLEALQPPPKSCTNSGRETATGVRNTRTLAFTAVLSEEVQ
jgi:hypothetical protein